MEWTGARYADGPTAEAEAWIDAPPERVFGLASDIALIAETSEELRSVQWCDGRAGPEVGATFLGHNANDALGEWTTTSYVTEHDPPRAFAWAVADPDEPTASWRFDLAAEAGGTRLRQWMRMGPAPSGLSLAIAAQPEKEQKIVFVRMRALEAAITETVAEIKRRAERS